MRWVVTGSSGMLGTDLVRRLRATDERVDALTHADLEITDARRVRDCLAGADVVVNCAAYTAVDAAEEDEGRAFRINAVGPQILAREARRAGARMVQISTDYVFGGASATPYGEDEPLDPRSAYGRTKGAGEWAVRSETEDHLIVRTAWLYGRHGGCFPRTMARLAAERDRLDVVSDQFGQPTWTVDVSDLVHDLVMAGADAGTYHATSSGSTSWFGFTQRIVASLGLDTGMVHETASAAFARPAPRPAYSVLGHDALVAAGVAAIGDWEERWAAAAETVLAP